MPFSLKTLTLLKSTGAAAGLIAEIITSIQDDFDIEPSKRFICGPPRTSRRRRTKGAPNLGTRAEVYKRDNWACVYCGEDNLLAMTLDHKMPLSRGGDHSMENLVTACSACNCEKADMTVEEWEHKKATTLPRIAERKPYTLRDVRRKPVVAHDAATVPDAQRELSRARKRDGQIVESSRRALIAAGISA